MDTDGNGIGDLSGIASKLDYIKSIGVNAIWLNPVFESGWFDGGYDIINFYKIDPRFGTNTDLVNLVDEAHRRGIKVCLDLVAGHSSDKCEWFRQSREKDPNGRYSDYYIWTDTISAKDKADIARRYKAKNPASSTIGRYVEADAPRAKYYEKNFFECQPALNYGFANPDPLHPWEQGIDAPGPQAVRRELRNIMAFWFDKGVDGFRVDMASSLIKNDKDKVETSRLWREMRKWKDERYPEKVLISEWSDPAVAIPAGFNIDFMMQFGVKGYPSLFFAKGTPWGKRNEFGNCYFDIAGRGTLSQFVKNYTYAYEKTRNLGYIALPSANHDFQRPNIGTRNTMEQLKVAMTFFLTMPGVPFIYYGDEIAMKYLPNLESREGSNNRAGARTPMQWAKGVTAGFSTCAPDKLYFPIDTDGGRLTVEAQDKDKGSMLNYVRQLTALRHATPALNNNGSWTLLSDTVQAYPMVYSRSDGAKTYIVALNPSGKAVSCRLPLTVKKSRTAVFTGKSKLKGNRIAMGPVSAAVIETIEK